MRGTLSRTAAEMQTISPQTLDRVAAVTQAGPTVKEVPGGSVRIETPSPLGRPVWVYESDVPVESEEHQRIFRAAFDELEEEFKTNGAGPLGVCLLIDDDVALAKRPEALWPEEGLIFAGYVDGSQLRVRWFWGATIEPGLPNSLGQDEALEMDWSMDESRYRVEPYGGDSEVAEQILAMWARENAVRPEEEARRRVHEAINVVIERDEGVVAVSTAFLQRNPKLDMTLWYFRTFVSSPHRNTHVSTQLTFHNRDLLERRYTSGEDTRAGGIAFELENQGMRKYLNGAIWLPANFLYIGDTEFGIPVRVHYFPGAPAPPPPSRRL
jgi:hypothetical protein